MAITVTHIGTGSGNFNSSIAASVGAGGVPSGSLILVLIGSNQGDWSGGTVITVSDTAGNSYVLGPRQSLSSGSSATTAIFYAYGSAPLVSGNSITAVNGGTSRTGCITVCYATGIGTSADPRLVACDAGKTGTTASGAFSGGIQMGAVPSAANSLAIGSVFVAGIGGTITVTNPAGWTTPPNAFNPGSMVVAGGNKVTSTQDTWAPTTNAANGKSYAMVTATFQPPDSLTYFSMVVGDGLIVPARDRIQSF